MTRQKQAIALRIAIPMLLAVATGAGAAPPAAAPRELATFHATIVKPSANVSLLPGHRQILAHLPGLGPSLLAVPNTDLQKLLSPVRPGDAMLVTVDDTATTKIVTAIAEPTRPVPPHDVLLALAGAAAFLFAACMLATGGRPIALVTGRDDRLSNSQCQLAIWFASVAIVYAATLVLRGLEIGTDFIGGVSINAHLVALTGLSAFTFGAAKAVTTQQVYDRAAQEEARNALLAAGQPPQPPCQIPPAPPAPPQPSPGPSLRDLARNAYGQIDIGDLQMILITIAAAAIFLCQSFWFLRDLPLTQKVELPDIDGTLLASFGLGQGAYLFKKAATPLNKG